MTQSKDDIFIDLSDLDIKLDDIMDTSDTITIDLNETYGATTTYWAGDSITDITVSGANDGTFTIDTNDTIDIGWIYNNINIDPYEVEKMCEHYPALEKAWRNFKSIYDMTKQDWEGKKKAGEVDDDVPF